LPFASRPYFRKPRGQPLKLTIDNGKEAFTVEAETVNEVGYFAVQKAMNARPKDEEKQIMLTVQAEPAPLRTDEHGVIRVGESQVLLDVVIREFHNGACPEDIVSGYSTLELADVYAVIAYYLRHREEVDAYLQARREHAERLRQEIEAKQPDRAQLRSKLLARKAQREQGHASSSK
jgi:uncharacterized protein (DUF433 family)